MLEPFRAWRPSASLAARIACLPYDVVTRNEARSLAAGNEQSFFHISRPEIDLPDSVDEHDPRVYTAGRVNWNAFRQHGWLQQDQLAAYYVYRQMIGSHTQAGIVGLASVSDYDRGDIRKHEHTRPDKEDDRTQHIYALGANDESVFLAYRAEHDIDALVAAVMSETPACDFVAEDGVRHSVWVVNAAQTVALQATLQSIKRLYIADGHHRCAAAARAHHRYREEDRAGSHGYFLATIFAHHQLRILDYNRVVSDLGAHAPAEFLQTLQRDFDVVPTQQKQPAQAHQFGLYLDRHWYCLTARAGSFPAAVIGALDVSILQENVLRKVLGIADVRSDPRVQFVGGIRGAAELERLVDSGQFRAAFSMFPTQLEELMSVADGGEVMPPKSTWFEPKLRSGLLAHAFW